MDALFHRKCTLQWCTINIICHNSPNILEAAKKPLSHTFQPTHPALCWICFSKYSVKELNWITSEFFKKKEKKGKKKKKVELNWIWDTRTHSQIPQFLIEGCPKLCWLRRNGIHVFWAIYCFFAILVRILAICTML